MSPPVDTTPHHSGPLSGLRTSSARVWMLSVLLAAAAATLALVGFAESPAVADQVDIRWWMIAPVFLLVEIFVVHLDVQREAQTISLSEVPIVVGLFFLPPGELILAQGIGAALALVAYRRQLALKAAFNIAQFAVVTGVAIVVFRALLPEGADWGLAAWGAALAAMIVADLVAAVLVGSAISLMEERISLPGLREFVGFGTLGTVANTALGLLAVGLLREDHLNALLLAVPLGVTYFAYRGFWREHQRSSHFEFLYRSMRRLSGADDIDGAVTQLLHEARAMFRADVAGVILFPVAEGERPLRSVLDEQNRLATLAPVRAHDVKEILQLDGPVLQDARPGGVRRACVPLGREVRDLMMVNLPGETRVVGVIAVADRSSDVNTFTRADLQILQTFATHAGVALENRRLHHSVGELSRERDELSHRALHDPLTWLPNRTHFTEMTQRALDSRRGDPSTRVALLFVDLDDFKSVNDTLGHEAGDRVLMAVAERLRACLRPGDTAARLGGDEFTILLEEVSGVEEAEAVGDRVLQALTMPIAVGERLVDVGASVGIAVAERSSIDAEGLLRRADQRMYVAKSQGKGQWATEMSEGGADAAAIMDTAAAGSEAVPRSPGLG